MSLSRLCSVLVLGLGLSASLAQAELKLDLPSTDLPDLGSPASAALSTTEEFELGKQLLRQVRRRSPLIEDPELSDWIRSLGNRLALNSGNRNGNLYFVIENSPDINAHTLAGGVIIINAGLILNTQSESELAAVMAHEIAHVSQRHIARMLAENQSNPLLTGLGVLAGAAVASQSPDAAQAIITGTVALQAHQQIVFSQRAESEADRVGLRILAASRFDPAAMPYFLEKLERSESDLYGDIKKYLQTHPLSIERLSDTRSQANQMGRITPSEDSSYLFAREKLRLLTGQSASSPRQAAPANLGKYTQALQQARAGNYQGVLQNLGTQAHQPPVALLIVEALMHLKRYPEAEQVAQALQKHFPGQESVALALAEAQAANNRKPESIQTLIRVNTSESTSMVFFETAQRIAQQAGYPAEATLFNAERSIRIGEYERAKATLEQAASLQTAHPQTLANIRNRLRDLAQMDAMHKLLKDQ